MDLQQRRSVPYARTQVIFFFFFRLYSFNLDYESMMQYFFIMPIIIKLYHY